MITTTPARNLAGTGGTPSTHPTPPRKRMVLGSGDACCCVQWAVNKRSVNPDVSLALPGDVQIIELGTEEGRGPE
jgi:hypothetical protein